MSERNLRSPLQLDPEAGRHTRRSRPEDPSEEWMGYVGTGRHINLRDFYDDSDDDDESAEHDGDLSADAAELDATDDLGLTSDEHLWEEDASVLAAESATDADVSSAAEIEAARAESTGAAESRLNFDGIDIAKGQHKAEPDILPIMASPDDERGVEIVGGVSSATSKLSFDLYKKLVRGIQTDDVKQAAKMLSEAAEIIQHDDPSFIPPAIFSVNQAGELAWSVPAGNRATATLVRVRRDQPAERLGSIDEDSHGVIHDLDAKDSFYLLPSELADSLEQKGKLNRGGLKEAYNDEAGPDVVRTQFKNAFVVPAETVATRNVKNIFKRKKDRAKPDSEQPVAAPTPLALAAPQAATFATRASASTDATAIPLEGRVVYHPSVREEPFVPVSAAEHPVLPGSVVTDSESESVQPVEATQVTGPHDTPDDSHQATESVTHVDRENFKPADAIDLSLLQQFVRSEAYDEARTAYNEADKKLAGKVARRLKLGMFAWKKTREAATADVQAERAEYERMEEFFDDLQVEKWKLAKPGITQQDLDAKLGFYHEAKLRLQGIRTQEALKTTHGKFGKLSELNDKATEWFSTLSRKQKVGLAIGGVLVGAGLGAAGAAVGGVAGAAGLATLAAGKIYKSSAQSRSGLFRNMSEVNRDDFKKADGKTYKSFKKQRKQSRTHFQEDLEQRSKKADHINKVAKWMTIGSAALLGAGAIGHIDAVHDVYKAVGEHATDWFDGLLHHSSGGVTMQHESAGPAIPHNGSSAHNPVDKLGSGDVYTRPKVPTGVHEVDYSPAALKVSAGEGWYRTFSEMGITQSHEQANLLNNNSLMDTLAKKGLAYQNTAGAWEMNMTPDGKMPRTALDLIRAYAKKDGYDLPA